MSDAAESRLSPYYLRTLHIDAYGSFSQRDVGPFSPGLNIVFGANEAGKTTVSSFVSGVLFGWDDARGQRNVYKPSNAERSGALTFASIDGDEPIQCIRVRNADGIKPDPEPVILDDIDRDTFRTIFALDSDELRGLGKTTDVTARLLTAGAGTVSSPAQVLKQVDDLLAARTSRSSAFVDSISNLQAALGETRDELAQASAEAERFKRENREFRELKRRRTALSSSLSKMNADVEMLSVQRDALSRLQAKLESLHEKDEQLQQRECDLRTREEARDAVQNGRLHLDAVEERALRAGVDDLAEECSRLEHGVALAKQDFALSRAGYEALQEADDIKEMRARVKRQRSVQTVLSVLLPLLFAVMGVPVFVHGREIGSLSVTTLGIVLVAIAVFMACAALVMLFRPNKTEEEMRKRLQDAQWVMLQDRKKLQACEDQLSDQQGVVRAYLEKEGLHDADGSIRRARAMLDEVRESRADDSLLAQQRQSLAAQRASLDESLEQNARERAEAYVILGEAEEVPLAVIGARLDRRIEQRDAQLRTSESINARYGELRNELSSARHMKRFDELKLESQLLQTRLDEALVEYARLLLAKRMLRASIAAWESKSQPRVYQQASRLLSMMTDGRWVRVRIGSGGNLQAIDAFEGVRDPSLLSLGTCQQLYLSLRIALLMTAENVGRGIPILADDILVNFDAERRQGAIRALQELAQRRQVIVFTCHGEVVRLMQDACSDVNLVRL